MTGVLSTGVLRTARGYRLTPRWGEEHSMQCTTHEDAERAQPTPTLVC